MFRVDLGRLPAGKYTAKWVINTTATAFGPGLEAPKEASTSDEAPLTSVPIVAFQLGVQPGPRERPISFASRSRNADRLGRFGNRHAGEVPQLHQHRLVRPALLQPAKRLVQRQQFFIAIRGRRIHRIQIKSPPTSAVPLAPLAARVLDQDSAHGFGCRRKEMSATVPLPRLVPIHQPQVGFMQRDPHFPQTWRRVLEAEIGIAQRIQVPR